MPNFTFKENLIYSDPEVYESLVTHFNRIADILKNKKFEWEDEGLPENEFNIGCDFEKWMRAVDEDHQATLEVARKNGEYTGREIFSPENTLKCFEPIKEYFDGFVYGGPTGIYNNQSFLVKSNAFYTYEELVEFVKELKQNTQTLFLYRVYSKIGKKLISGDIYDPDSELVYGEECDIYKLRYIDFPAS